MPRLFTATQIADLALQKIGAFSPRDGAADPDEQDRALAWLDLVVGHLTGTRNCYWLIPNEFTLPLTVGQREYDLMTVMGADYPEGGIQFIRSVWLLHPNVTPTRRTPIKLLRRAEYDAIELRNQSGTPEQVYIDRQNLPKLSVWPVTSLTGYSLALDYYTYSQDLLDTSGNRPHGLPAAWQLWASVATAAEIGDGPVRRLKPETIKGLQAQAERARKQLDAHHNAEQVRPRFVRYRDC